MYQVFAKAVLGTFLGLTVLAACSAKVDGGGDPVLKQTEEPQIAGPDLNGVWASSCVYGAFAESKRITMVIKDKSLSRTIERFTDSNCQDRAQIKGDDGTSHDDILTQNGDFIFQNKFAGEIFQVEYRFDIGGGVRWLVKENVRRDEKTLWVAEDFFGEGIKPETPLALIGNVK